MLFFSYWQTATVFKRIILQDTKKLTNYPKKTDIWHTTIIDMEQDIKIVQINVQDTLYILLTRMLS